MTQLNSIFKEFEHRLNQKKNIVPKCDNIIHRFMYLIN